MLPPMLFNAAAAMAPSGVPVNTLLVCQRSRNAKMTYCFRRSMQTSPQHRDHHSTPHSMQSVAPHPGDRPSATAHGHIGFALFVARTAELWLDMAMAHAPNHVACPAQSNQIQRTSNAHHEIHGCCWLDGLDCPHDIAIRDEPDACTLGHQLVMPRAVENRNRAIPSHMWTVTRFPYAVISSKACLTGVHVRFHVQVSICSLSATECLLYGM